MTDEKPQIEIAGDDDWKARVKAEDAKLDAEHQSQTQQPSGQAKSKIDASQLPQASFTMLVQMFSTQSMVALGVIPGPDGEPMQNLPLAKHFVDLLAVLDEKCKGNLTTEEDRLLDQSLHELRLAYVQISKATAAEAPASQ